MKKPVVFLLALLLVLGGCISLFFLYRTGSEMIESAKREERVERSDQMYAAFQRNMQSGAALVYAKNVQVVLDDSTTARPEQIGDVFSFGDMLFVTILQPSSTVTVNLPQADVKSAGILASIDDGASWTAFFSTSLKRIQYTKETGYKNIYWNVAGLFVQDGKMYIDTVDENDLLIRYEVSDEGKTKGFGKDSCFDFSASTYYVPSPEDRQSINPELPATTKTCTRGNPEPIATLN